MGVVVHNNWKAPPWLVPFYSFTHSTRLQISLHTPTLPFGLLVIILFLCKLSGTIVQDSMRRWPSSCTLLSLYAFTCGREREREREMQGWNQTGIGASVCFIIRHSCQLFPFLARNPIRNKGNSLLKS